MCIRDRFGLPVGEFDIGIVFEKWSEMIATLEYLRAMQVALDTMSV